MVIQALNIEPLMIVWEFDAIIEEILSLLAGLSSNNVQFRYVSRQANMVVDWIAKHESLLSYSDITCNPHIQLSRLLHKDVLHAVNVSLAI